MGGNTTKSTSSQTTTPVNPAWVTSSLQDFNSRVNQLYGADPKAWTTPATALQNQAFQGAQGLGDWRGAFDQSAAQSGQAVASARALPFINDYMNPYSRDVMDASLAGFDQDAGRQRAQMEAQGAASGAFGGSRFGVGQALMGAQQGMDRAQLRANLLSQGYNSALGAAEGDASRLTGANQAAAGLLANLGSAQASNARADLDTQQQMGAIQRGMNAEANSADISRLQTIGQLLGVGQFGLLRGSSSTGVNTAQQNPGLLASIGQGAQAIGSLAALFGGG